MKKMLIAAVACMALASMARAESGDNWSGVTSPQDKAAAQYAASMTPSTWTNIKGVSYELWVIIRGFDGGYSGSGNNTGNYSVGGSGRAR